MKQPLAMAAAILAAHAADAPARAVATFESIGLYWNRADGGAAAMRYCEAGKGDWREAYPPVHDPRLKEYCGSVVGLTSDTT